MDFVIDTKGLLSPENAKSSVSSNKELITKLLEEYQEESAQKEDTQSHSSNKGTLVSNFFNEMRWNKEKTKKKKRSVIDDLDIPKNEIDSVLKKSVLTSEFEKKHVVPPFEISEKLLKKQRKKESEKTKGKKWYGLPATELTEEIKQNLEILQMRSVLDSKRFYKKNDLKVLPKYFQMGKVLDSPLDFYNNRLTNKERKKTLVDELLADAEFNKYNKRKFKEIIQEKQKTHYKAWRQAKRLKKKK